jgi:hypothetical protein
MITMDEILMGRAKFDELSLEIQANLTELHRRINLLRDKIARPLKVNDGLRRLGIDKPKNGAAKSKHYLGQAIDLDDDDSAWLWNWCRDNLHFLAEIGLWMEDPRWTHGNGTWMHFQIVPPGSGKRIFIPSTKPASAPNLWDGKYDKSLDG